MKHIRTVMIALAVTLHVGPLSGQEHPLVQEAVRLFDAEVIRVEERRGG